MAVRYVYVTSDAIKIPRPLRVSRRVPIYLEFGIKHKIPLYLLYFKTSYRVTAKRNKKDFTTSPKPRTQAALANICTRSTMPDRREYFVTSMSNCANAIKTPADCEMSRQYSLIQQRNGNDEYEIVLRKKDWAIPCPHGRRELFYCVLFML